MHSIQRGGEFLKCRKGSPLWCRPTSSDVRQRSCSGPQWSGQIFCADRVSGGQVADVPMCNANDHLVFVWETEKHSRGVFGPVESRAYRETGGPRQRTLSPRNKYSPYFLSLNLAPSG